VEWLIHLPVLMFSVVVHEFCHGWAAYARGDDTAERAGRLTLNPGRTWTRSARFSFLCFAF